MWKQVVVSQFEILYQNLLGTTDKTNKQLIRIAGIQVKTVTQNFKTCS